MRLAGALVAALFAAIGCGGSGMPVAAAAAPAQDAGTPPPDAGPVPVPDAGTAPDAGAAQPDGGPPDAGPDAGVDGGATGCAALVPAGAGEAVVVDLDLGDPSQACSAAQPDEGGAVPLRIATYDTAGMHRTAWAFYAADGTLLSRREWTAGLGPISLLTQPEGFTGAGFASDPGQVSLDLYSLAHGGADLAIARTASAPGDGDAVADPSGGTVLFSVRRDAAVWLLEFERYDERGNRTAKAVDGLGGPLAADVRWVAGVTTGGDTLVVAGPAGGSCRALWLDHDGATVSGGFAPPNCRIHRFYPLLDGRLAVETESLDASHSISAAVAPRATAFEAAPAFLEGLSVRELFTLPGGKGYAVREQGAGERLRVFLPEGVACGALPAPALDKGPVQIGRDGTLVEQDLTGAGCRFRWYPGLFR